MSTVARSPVIVRISPLCGICVLKPASEARRLARSYVAAPALRIGACPGVTNTLFRLVGSVPTRIEVPEPPKIVSDFTNCESRCTIAFCVNCIARVSASKVMMSP